MGATLHPETKFLVIGTPGDVRVAGFGRALADAGLPPAEVVSYPELLTGERDRIAQAMERADWLRIESPGRDPEAVDAIRAYALLGWGYGPAHAKWQEISRAAAYVREPKGLIDRPTFYASGFRNAIHLLNSRPLSESNPRFINHPEEIESACDKSRSASRLAAAGIPIPMPISATRRSCSSYAGVRRLMANRGCARAFIKLAYGSAASGVVAYRFSATREQATTTVALHQTSGGVVLCNTRKIQRYEDPAEVRLLLDTLCPMGVYVEQWVPKAGVAGRTADLRVVTIAGEPRHTVLRLSRSPITNLHLLNERADPALLREQMSADDWDAAMETCRRVARCFPQMLYLGIDLAVHADLRGHTVLEVNAFGDLLHGVTDRGQTTYEAQLDALADWGMRDA